MAVATLCTALSTTMFAKFTPTHYAIVFYSFTFYRQLDTNTSSARLTGKHEIWPTLRR